MWPSTVTNLRQMITVLESLTRLWVSHIMILKWNMKVPDATVWILSSGPGQLWAIISLIHCLSARGCLPAIQLPRQDWVKPSWGRRTSLSTGTLAICCKMQKEIGAKNLLQSHFASSVPQSLLSITLSDKMSDKGWRSKILAWDRAKNRSGSREQMDEETSFYMPTLYTVMSKPTQSPSDAWSPRPFKPTFFTQNNLTCIQLT